MSKTNLRIGLAGAGIMGTGHATYLSQHVPGANVVAICEPHAEASSALVDDLSPDERPLVQFVSALGA